MAIEDLVLADAPYVYLPVDTAGTEQLGTANATVTKSENAAVVSGGFDGGSAVLFPRSSGQYVRFRDAPIGDLKNLTVEWWMRSTQSESNDVRIIYMYTGAFWFSAFFDATVNGPLNVRYGNYPTGYVTINTGVRVNDGEWHHVVATADNGLLKVYVDGDLRGSNSATATASSTSGDYWILGQSGQNTSLNNIPNRLYEGMIDHFALYRHALPEERVLAHYNWGVDPEPAEPAQLSGRPAEADFTAVAASLDLAQPVAQAVLDTGSPGTAAFTALSGSLAVEAVPAAPYAVKAGSPATAACEALSAALVAEGAPAAPYTLDSGSPATAGFAGLGAMLQLDAITADPYSVSTRPAIGVFTALAATLGLEDAETPFEPVGAWNLMVRMDRAIVEPAMATSVVEAKMGRKTLRPTLLLTERGN